MPTEAFKSAHLNITFGQSELGPYAEPMCMLGFAALNPTYAVFSIAMETGSPSVSAKHASRLAQIHIAMHLHATPLPNLTHHI